ncbi:MAG: O-antigen ligase family protein [Chloroflexota bacterium]
MSRVSRFTPHWLLEGLVLLLAAPFLLFPTLSTAATALALVLVALSWLVAWRLTGRPWPLTPLNGAMLVWGVMLGVGMVVSADPDLTLPKATGLILGLATWRYLAVWGRSGRGVRLAVAGFALLGVGMALVGLLSADWRLKAPFLETLIGQLPPPVLVLREAPAAGIQPNQLAGTVVVYAPLLAAGLLRRRRLERLVLALALLLTLGLLLLTQSRSAWLGTAAGLLALLALWGTVIPPSCTRRVIGLGLAVAAGLAALALWLVGWEGLQAFWVEPPSATFIGALTTLNFRQEVWRWAITAIGDFPLTGCGLGAFRAVLPRLYPTTIGLGYDVAHAHNVFLQVALDVGLPGLVGYVAILVTAGVIGWQVARRDVEWRPLALGLLAGLVALHTFGLTDALAPGSKTGLVFWAALGLLTALAELSMNNEQ